MFDKGLGFLDKLLHRRSMRRWSRAARRSKQIPLSELRRLRNAARGLRSHLDRVLYRAEERLALSGFAPNSFPRPHDTDWAWRPELWRGPLAKPGLSSVSTRAGLGNEISVFHDCANSELTLRQVRNLKEKDLAPFGLSMDVFSFDGSFLSVVVDLPGQVTDDLRKSHLIRMDCIVEMEEPIEIFARLNVKHGPNTEQLVRELPLHETDVFVEFDLAYSKLKEKRVDRAWIDLIFENPSMNRVVVRDLTFSRRPRAAL
ncbi:MAG: DUF6478 family protein [Paracoccaceae bacterium]